MSAVTAMPGHAGSTRRRTDVYTYASYSVRAIVTLATPVASWRSAWPPSAPPTGSTHMSPTAAGSAHTPPSSADAPLLISQGAQPAPLGTGWLQAAYARDDGPSSYSPPSVPFSYASNVS